MKTITPKINCCLILLIIMLSILLPGTAEAAQNKNSSAARIYGTNQYQTAAKIAEAGWTGNSNYAILASGTESNLTDALTAAPLAAKLNAPILLTEEESLNSFAKQELTRLKVKTVFLTITSSSAGNLQHITDQLKGIPTITSVVVLGGNDSAQTSVNIAKELTVLGTEINKVIIVSGSGADALSISPVADAQGIPILYTSGDCLSSCVSDYVNSLSSKLNKIYLIGETGVISDTAAAQLPSSVEWITGVDQYDTNIQVLRRFATIFKYKTTYLANGNKPVNALAVSPLAAQTGSPILLTSQSLPSSSLTYATANLAPNFIALGSEAEISSNTLARLTALQVISKSGQTQGAKDESHPSTISSALKISGNNITLRNSTSNYSIDLQGNNVKLNNVTTKGTLFIDPGTNGTDQLQNVTASNIVILSGGSGISLQNITANSLIIASSDKISLTTSGTTNIGQTTVTSPVTLDNSKGGSFGLITIMSASQSGPIPLVQFMGTFSQPITVNDSATIIGSSNASIDNVTIITNYPNQTVTLQGSLSNVNVDSQANITIADNTTIQSLTNNANVNITVPASSSIINLITNNNSQPGDQPPDQPAIYFGADSGTGSNIYGNDFYIGQLGYGKHQHFDAASGGDDAGGSFFKGTGAQNASSVYGYWLLSGFSSAPSGTTAAAWGQQQAQLAIKAFNDMNTFYGSKAKPVIFVDIEDCGGGLDNKDYTNNQAIYTAFINWLEQNSSVKPGTYSSPYEWNSLTMGPSFQPLTAGYYWLADYPGGTPEQSTINTSNQFWLNFPQTSEQAEIWQYEGTPDYNAARILPN